jgi:tRNA (cmo5U34)-methyltransferase
VASFKEKSTVEEIRQRFDQDVERFSCLETGQQALIDSPLGLTLVASAAATHLKPGASVLDLGCGAGNLTLRVMQTVGPIHAHLLDLSGPMLERAESRVRAAGALSVQRHQQDFRSANFPADSFDCILAGAVLHHLREEDDWLGGFKQLSAWIKPGGRLYVADMVCFQDAAVDSIMVQRFAEYLESLGGPEYREKVFAYIEKEDSPRSLPFQIELLKRVGFRDWEVLHRNSVFACYYAQK